jgi:nucleoid DNA-binding protein
MINNKLTKITDSIVEESGFDKEQVAHAVETFFRYIKQSIKNNVSEIYIPKFGKMIQTKRKKK